MAKAAPGRWTAEEHARLLVAIIKVGNPRLDTKAIAEEMGGGRTGGAIYFEIRRIKLSVGASTAKNGRKRPDVDVKRPDIDIKAEAAPEATLPSPESSPIRQRPVRTPKASAKKRLHDEVGDSGFWDDDTEEDSRPAKASKRAKVVKAVDDDDVNADEADFVVDDADSSTEA